jgi:hypothetical protein
MIVIGALFMLVGALPFFVRPRVTASSYAVARARFIGFLFAGFGLFLATHALLAMVGGTAAIGIGVVLMALGAGSFLRGGPGAPSARIVRVRVAGAVSFIVGLFAAAYGLLAVTGLVSPPRL